MMDRRNVWIVAIAIVVSVPVGSAQEAADTILYNGKVLTVDKNFSTAQAVAVRGSQIAAVGTDDEVLRLAGPNTDKIDLKGRTVTPGLINTHVHLESIGSYARDLGAAKTREFSLNVRGVKTKDEVLKQIRDVIAAFKFRPGEWLLFVPSWTADQAKLIYNDLNAAELDKAAPNNPIVMSVGMPYRNINMVNGVALKELSRKYGDFLKKYGRYWIDAAGKANGILEPPASRIPFEDQEFALGPKPEEIGPYYRKILIETYSSVGVTALSGSLGTSTVRAYQWLDSRGEMPLRYGYGAMSGFHPGANLKQYKLGAGTDNVFLTSLSARATDGGGVRMCISVPRRDQEIAANVASQGDSLNDSAADWWPRGQCNLDIEYSGPPGRGARISGNYFVEWYRDVAQEGLRSANAHVAGDRSVTLMIDAWEKIDKIRPGAVKTWAFDHCDLVDPRDIPRAARLGLMFSCKTSNVVATNPAKGAEAFNLAYGEQVHHTYVSPFKSMLDAGINVSLEQEGGLSFWSGIEHLITRKDDRGRVWGAMSVWTGRPH